ncbi:S53 family peptidase [Paraburkholderia sp. GAS348]|uniref:S53 family peptidase n=1 Tax=Paraburkholderia sp. GAS348 TaxID=3035132 RepID=UPI003D1AF821
MFKRPNPVFVVSLLIPIVIFGKVSVALAQSARQLVTQVVDESKTVELPGNTRPELNALNEGGRVDDTLVLYHVQLLLKRPAERDADLARFITSIHDPKSAHFHQWLTAAQFRSEFGPADADVNAVSDWLSRHGLTVNGVESGGMVIDFSGTAGQIRDAFRTEIHHIVSNGVTHIANVSNPRIPVALADAVRGIVSLSDFKPHTNFIPRSDYTYTSGNATRHAVVPADLATIYNVNPLFRSGVSGQGQTIVVIENTNVYNTADWTTFRSTFGLSGYTSGSFTQVHPAAASSANNCSNPGVVAASEREAVLDAEWASAAAPGASIVLASCGDTSTTFGGLIALQNVVNGINPPAIISVSYGECEAKNGAAANAAYATIYQQAAALGISVFVAAGDQGATSCDAGQSISTHGIGVSGLASTPYNVAVGGTDFGDASAGVTGSYWNSGNTSTYGSAISYIPEIPWNNSCASVLIAKAYGYSTTYGANGFCNGPTGKAAFLTISAGSGGPSGCATGSPSLGGVVSGTCKGYAKPAWQPLATGNPPDGVRDIPDVSLFAASGVWGHYYVVCDTDTSNGGVACTGAPSGWSGGGGTSFSAPIWAGFQALVNQYTGEARQGNPSPVYYELAAVQNVLLGSSVCNSSLGNRDASNCIFYNVTSGDMDVNCSGSNNCFLPSGTYGVLSTSGTSYAKAYGASTGWNFATGIGTVNVSNLAINWLNVNYLVSQVLHLTAIP